MLICIIASLQQLAIGICMDRSKKAWKLGWNSQLITIIYSVRKINLLIDPLLHKFKIYYIRFFFLFFLFLCIERYHILICQVRSAGGISLSSNILLNIVGNCTERPHLPLHVQPHCSHSSGYHWNSVPWWRDYCWKVRSTINYKDLSNLCICIYIIYITFELWLQYNEAHAQKTKIQCISDCIHCLITCMYV